jgi:hypothetical protein
MPDCRLGTPFSAAFCFLFDLYDDRDLSRVVLNLESFISFHVREWGSHSAILQLSDNLCR